MAKNEYDINQRIVQIRKTLGFSQEKFARGLKLSRSFQGGIEAKHRKVNERLAALICLTYGVSENWLKSGAGEMFEGGRDPRLERIIRNFKSMDPLLQDYLIKYIDWLSDNFPAKPG